MSKNIMTRNFYSELRRDNMITIASFTMAGHTTETHLILRAMAPVDTHVNFSAQLDVFYVYNKNINGFITNVGKSIYHDADITIPANENDYTIDILVDPQTIYKIKNISFDGNSNIRKVDTFYGFNISHYPYLFKDCYNILSYDDDIGPTTAYVDDIYNFDKIFANNFSVTKLPKDLRGFDNTDGWLNASLAYAFMNTTKYDNSNEFFSNIYGFNITPFGANGLFFNSNIKIQHTFDFSNAYQLKNTFSGMNQEYLYNGYLKFTNAADIESVFRKSNVYKTYEITISRGKLDNINNAFKNNTNVITVQFTDKTYPEDGPVLPYDCISVFSGCTGLNSISKNIIFAISEDHLIIDVFKNCISLPNDQFFYMGLANAHITSGIYDNCQQLSDIESVSLQTDAVEDSKYFQLYKTKIINNLFKDCIKLKDFTTRTIRFLNPDPDHTLIRDIYADGTFENCNTLSTIPNMDRPDLIISAAEMFRDCTGLQNADNNSFSSVKNASGMFLGCKGLIGTTHLPSSIIASCAYMDCDSLMDATMDFSNAKYLASLFRNCVSLSDGGLINSSNINKAEDISNMFEGCTGLTDLSNKINTRNVKTMVGLFKGCRNLTNVSVDLTSAENIDSIFYGCNKLSNIDLTFNSVDAPILNFRGTAITSDNFETIVNKLPDVSHFNEENIVDKLSSTTWQSSTQVYLIDEQYTNSFKSYSITLKPALYRLHIPESSFDCGACVINADTNEVMSTYIYNNKYALDIPVYINKEGNYIVMINSETNNKPNVSLYWEKPFYQIDIRNTPANLYLDNNVVSIANGKGWYVLYDEDTIMDRSTTYGLRHSDEYENCLNGIELYYVDNDMWTTEIFNIPCGYYTLYSENNINDKFKVYKVLSDGEYPIAMSYSKDYVLCFNISEDCDIRIMYRNEASDLFLIKS